jgi:hypothetical protein
MELVWAVIPKPSDEEEGECIFISEYACELAHTIMTLTLITLTHCAGCQTPVWKRPCRMYSSMA